MAQPTPAKEKQWYEKISRSGYFLGAVLLHLIVFFMVATWVIFPAFNPPTEDFNKTYLPPSAPPPPPPPAERADGAGDHAYRVDAHRRDYRADRGPRLSVCPCRILRRRPHRWM